MISVTLAARRRIRFTLPVCPQALQTSGKRMVIVGGRPRFFKNRKAQVYLDAIGGLAGQYRPASPFRGPISLDLFFVLPRPKSLMTKTAPDGLIPHTKRPDLDNLVKGTQDGLSLAGFWADDSQIFAGNPAKFYSEKGGQARIAVSITEI